MKQINDARDYLMRQMAPSNELYHSDVYLGQDFDEGLMHFKYIKRYRNSKGKWVYVYGNEGVHKEASNNQILSDRYSEWADKSGKVSHIQASQDQRKRRDAYLESNSVKTNVKNTIKKVNTEENRRRAKKAVKIGAKFAIAMLASSASPSLARELARTSVAVDATNYAMNYAKNKNKR